VKVLILGRVVATALIVMSIATSALPKDTEVPVSSLEFIKEFGKTCVANFSNLQGLLTALRKIPGNSRGGSTGVENVSYRYFILANKDGNDLCALRAEISDPEKLNGLLWEFAKKQDKAAKRTGVELINLELFGGPATITSRNIEKDGIGVVMIDRLVEGE
jgi:hypothetical protein